MRYKRICIVGWRVESGQRTSHVRTGFQITTRRRARPEAQKRNLHYSTSESRREKDAVTDAGADALIKNAAFLGGRERGHSNRSGAVLRNLQRAPAVTPQLFTRHHIVACELEVYHLRSEIEHDGCIDFVTMHCFRLALEQLRQVHSEDVHDSNAGAGGDDCSECFLVWIVPVRGEKNELLEPGCFPCVEKVVEGPVERLLSHR